MQKVNILGTEYELSYDLADDEFDGTTNFYGKKINIKPIDGLFADEKGVPQDEKEHRGKEVVRHELWHAIFYESGAERYAQDEDLVQLLAIQSPKVFKVFSELGIL